ncbi:helix-turn-helix domain-containing protein [Streptomyces sp. P38-E01]|uniref:Helix-turn-helix domain-containing protein n=1 Tax=Streptomyces tardus TaxID=2780544 RepID=A0A949JQL2_9ACTN|nr:helix-turn-helix domain-containing protein [Streptomyces tardus]MBU7599446.1 helix-turn-helix domain-containing protein [Streptomyces tardus]
MNNSARPDGLGAFLRARRGELSPRTVGLPEAGGRRRVSGLRRQEVAALAAISTDYYTRLEQGRTRASAAVLIKLARVLHLDDDRRAQLFALAGELAERPVRRAVQQARPRLRRVLHDLHTTPALVLGRSTDVLAWNSLAAALITDFSQVPKKQRNFIRILFADPAMRKLHADWGHIARTCVAQLQTEAARDPGNPRLTSLVGELSVRDEDFRRWWGTHEAPARTVGTTTMHHPVVGELTLDWEALAAVGTDGQQVLLWTAERGSPSHDGLRILASWSRSSETEGRPNGPDPSGSDHQRSGNEKDQI